ncbi:hypothetical protein HYH03_012293 [Edaphochlamys debaryana]|uniref:Polymerase nucleotidyl transferase domain-containing protein n=1 Tax=Edaphochlamys debaryana TaxID=47281 RepID=A0A835XS92_9CHLO|nr:hypothetical protein HYH03_012293 [Edaphochlamys debaryana]|eukprot:KAG2489273.1 hypothetical protein HYH03_012293 [Edaphochlamys debaryana]
MLGRSGLRPQQAVPGRPVPAPVTPRARGRGRSLVARVLGFAEAEGRYKKQPSRLVRRAYQQYAAKTSNFPESLLSPGAGQSTWSGSASERRVFADGFWENFTKQLSAEVVETEPAGKAVDRLYSLVQQLPGVKVSRAHKGGSYGRGTMVAGNFDVDLLIFVLELDGRALTLEDWLNDPRVGNELRRRVREALQARAPEWKAQISETGHYRYAMRLTLGEMEVKVDLLLLPDVAKGPNNWVRRQHDVLVKSVYGNPGGVRHSVLRGRADSWAFTEFVRGQDPNVRLAARALKAWRDGLDAGAVPNCGIGSVALEVLVLAAHQELQSQGPKGSDRVYQVRLFVEALRLLVAAVEGGRVVTVDAGDWGPPHSILRHRHCWVSEEGEDPVKIIHPIDPTCNVAHQRRDKPTAKWQAVAVEAKALLAEFEDGTLRDVLAMLTPAILLQRSLVQDVRERMLGPRAPGGDFMNDILFGL